MKQGTGDCSKRPGRNLAWVIAFCLGAGTLGFAGGATADMADPAGSAEFGEYAALDSLSREFGSLPLSSAELDDIRGGFRIGDVEIDFGFVLRTFLNGTLEVENVFGLSNVGDTLPGIVVTSIADPAGGPGTTVTTQLLNGGEILTTNIVNQQGNINLEQINTAVIDIVLPSNLVRSVQRGHVIGGLTAEMGDVMKLSLGVLAPSL